MNVKRMFVIIAIILVLSTMLCACEGTYNPYKQVTVVECIDIDDLEDGQVDLDINSYAIYNIARGNYLQGTLINNLGGGRLKVNYVLVLECEGEYYTDTAVRRFDIGDTYRANVDALDKLDMNVETE